MNADTKKILLVEDEKNILEIYKLILESAGYDVATALDGKSALNLCQSATPDLILLDLMMPVMDGVEFIEKLRSKAWGKEVPIIIMTNVGASEVPKGIDDEHIVDILIKVELSPDQLIEKVNQTMNK